MATEIEQVKSGYASLTYSFQRDEVKRFIEEFDRKTDAEKKVINEKFDSSVRNKSLGPVSSSKCSCCGR